MNAHAGVLVKVNLRHISAGAPVIAQTGGKSFATSCDCQTWTLAKVQSQQLVEPAVKARLSRHLPDRQQDAWNVRLPARGAVGDRQGLPRQAEDHLLVGDEAGQAHAVHGDVALLPTSRPGERLLLSLAVRERLVTAPGAEPARGRQRGARRRVQLARVVQLDDLGRVEV